MISCAVDDGEIGETDEEPHAGAQSCGSEAIERSSGLDVGNGVIWVLWSSHCELVAVSQIRHIAESLSGRMRAY
jgi:hypothetical protein